MEETKRLTKHQIIDETVEYYTTHSRATTEYGCEYRTKEGALCAHSRCLTDEIRNQIRLGSAYGTADDVINDFGGDDVHQEQYRGHDVKFWNDIQSLHDCKRYWVKTEIGNEITASGIEQVNNLKEIYGN